MHIFKVSETVFPGAELQLSLRLSTQALATLSGKSAPKFETGVECDADLDPVRRYMAAIAAKLPVLLNAGSEVLLEHQIQQLELENAQKLKELDELKREISS